jgi:hypothetical protein
MLTRAGRYTIQKEILLIDGINRNSNATDFSLCGITTPGLLLDSIRLRRFLTCLVYSDGLTLPESVSGQVSMSENYKKI